MYLAFYSVHTPLQTTKKLDEKYTEKGGDILQHNAKYAGMIESVDTNIGRLMDKLDELGLTDNTLVLFTSDNGGVWGITSQSPLRAGKGSYYEGGIRVPMIARWPGVIKPGRTCDTPVINIDFYPTFLDVAGVACPNGKLLDGVSLMPLLRGTGNLPQRPLFWHFPIYLEQYKYAANTRDPLFRTRPGSVIRFGDWKLHEYFEDGGLELYNLKDDIGETTDLAKSMPGKVKELHQMLIDWRTEVGAPIPTELNPKYKGN